MPKSSSSIKVISTIITNLINILISKNSSQVLWTNTYSKQKTRTRPAGWREKKRRAPQGPSALPRWCRLSGWRRSPHEVGRDGTLRAAITEALRVGPLLRASSLSLVLGKAIFEIFQNVSRLKHFTWNIWFWNIFKYFKYFRKYLKYCIAGIVRR